MRNQKGLISFLLLVLFLIVVMGILTIEKDRMVIADQIKSGSLTLTSQAMKWLSKGDDVMESMYINPSGTYIDKRYWVSIFYAKVCYERARFEMEMSEKGR